MLFRNSIFSFRGIGSTVSHFGNKTKFGNQKITPFLNNSYVNLSSSPLNQENKLVISELREIDSVVDMVENDFFDLLPNLVDKSDLYMSSFNKVDFLDFVDFKVDFVGLDSCGASSWLLKGLFDLKDSTGKYKTYIIGREDGNSEAPNDHVYIGISSYESDESYIIDPTWKQFYFRSVDIHSLPSIIIGTEDMASEFFKKISGGESTPWHFYDSYQEEDDHQMKSYKLKQNFIDLDIKQIMLKHKNQEQDFRKNKSVMTRPLIKNVLEEIEKRYLNEELDNTFNI